MAGAARPERLRRYRLRPLSVGQYVHGALRPPRTVLLTTEDAADPRYFWRQSVLCLGTGARDGRRHGRHRGIAAGFARRTGAGRIGRLTEDARHALLAASVWPTPKWSRWRKPLTRTPNSFCRSWWRPRTRASSRLSVTDFDSPTRCWRTGSTRMPPRVGAGRCIGDWRTSLTNPNSRRDIWHWPRRVVTHSRCVRLTRQLKWLAVVEPRRPRPNSLTWRSNWAETPPSGTSSRPRTTSTPATLRTPARCWSALWSGQHRRAARGGAAVARPVELLDGSSREAAGLFERASPTPETTSRCASGLDSAVFRPGQWPPVRSSTGAHRGCGRMRHAA